MWLAQGESGLGREEDEEKSGKNYGRIGRQRTNSKPAIHFDLNKFNFMVRDVGMVTMIDFPQMIWTEHENAAMHFDRDIACIRTFCERRFGFIAKEYPRFSEVAREATLDLAVAAS